MVNSRILGIDPGLRITGYAIIEARAEEAVLVEAGVIRGGEGSLDLRLRTLHGCLLEVIDQFHPVAMAIEQLYAHYNHPRTAIIMGHARGVMILAASLRNIPTHSYSATMIKKMITGAGRASKEQIQRTVAQEMGLSEPPQPPDVADALAVAICHFHAARRERNSAT